MTVAAEQHLEDLPIGSIRASSTNPRRHFDDASLAELTASIAEVGLQQLPLVRPVRGQDDGDIMGWEIVTGERRWRAFKLMGREGMPCLVREIGDDEAREIQIVENLQREGIHPLEEAEAFQQMLESRGSIAAVAARFGKQESYVAKCLRLTALTPWSRDALRASLITLDHALLLARLAETEQNAALKWTLDHSAGSKTTVQKVLEERLAQRKKEEGDKGKGGGFRNYVWEPQSVVRLKSWIEDESGILLSRAPWSLTDEDYLLPDVGPCSECPKNTKANAPLFGDLEMGEATCTDGACFQAKTAGFVRIAMRTAGHDGDKRANVTIPRLSWKLSSVKPSITPNGTGRPGQPLDEASPTKVLKKGQWVEAKKGSCANVREGVTVDWSDDRNRGYVGRDEKVRKPGELLTVCIAVGCKAHPKAWEEAAKSSSNSNRGGLSYEERRKIEDGKEKVYVEAEAPVRMAIYKAVKAKVKLDQDGMLRALILDAVTDDRNSCPVEFCLANGYEFERPSDDNWKWRENARGAIRTEVPKLSGAQLVSAAFDALCAHYVKPNRRMYANRKQDRKAMWEWAKRHGVDAEPIAKTFELKKPKAAAKKSVAKKAAAPVKKGAKSKPVKLSAEAKKRIAANMKKRWPDARKATAKKKAVA